MRVKIAYNKSNCPLMICENIFKFMRDSCYSSYINTPKWIILCSFITYINELPTNLKTNKPTKYGNMEIKQNFRHYN